MMDFQTMSYSTSSIRAFLIFMTSGGQIGYGFYSGGIQLAKSSAPYTNAWHLVVASMSNTAGATLYVDTSLVASNTVSSGISGGWTAGNLGFWRMGNGDFGSAWGTGQTSAYWGGLMQDVRVLNRALSPTDVTNLYNAGPQ